MALGTSIIVSQSSVLGRRRPQSCVVRYEVEVGDMGRQLIGGHPARQHFDAGWQWNSREWYPEKTMITPEVRVSRAFCDVAKEDHPKSIVSAVRAIEVGLPR
jgi:hypothetical protein